VLFRSSGIWSDSPSSATVIKRFLEFEGIGPKTSTMAVNILARYFKIPMSDCYSIEVTVDGRTKRVLSRMGIVDSPKPKYIQLTIREMYPKYPGIFDSVFWEIGKFYCFPIKPNCNKCPVNGLCLYSRSPRKIEQTA
jgi:endonuclease-3